MTPPACPQVDYIAELGEPEPVPAPSDPGIPAAWMILAMFIAVAIFEIWALHKDKNTISQLIQRMSRTRRWFRWLGVIAMGILTWHIFWGFPW